MVSSTVAKYSPLAPGLASALSGRCRPNERKLRIDQKPKSVQESLSYSRPGRKIELPRRPKYSSIRPRFYLPILRRQLSDS